MCDSSFAWHQNDKTFNSKEKEKLDKITGWYRSNKRERRRAGGGSSLDILSHQEKTSSALGSGHNLLRLLLWAASCSWHGSRSGHVTRGSRVTHALQVIFSADSVHLLSGHHEVCICVCGSWHCAGGEACQGGHWRMRPGIKPVYSMPQLLLGAVHTTGNLQGLVKMSNEEITQQWWSERYRMASLLLALASKLE